MGNERSPEQQPQTGRSRDDEPLRLIHVYQERPEDDDGTCLRPLGLCELGGACDTCWYNPAHPRFS